jgi:hypothetical protein
MGNQPKRLAQEEFSNYNISKCLGWPRKDGILVGTEEV